MPYTPPGPKHIWYEFREEYETPNGCNIVFKVGESPDIDTFGFVPSKVEFFIEPGTLQSYSGEMIIPKTVNILMPFANGVVDPVWPISIKNATIGLSIAEGSVEILPDIITKNMVINSSIGGSVIRGTQDFHLPATTSSDVKRFGWDTGGTIDKKHMVIWDTPKDVKVDTVARVVEHGNKDFSFDIPWEEMKKIDIKSVGVMKNAGNEFDVSYLAGHKILTSYDLEVVVPWAGFTESNRTFDLQYYHPEPKDMHYVAPWDTPTEHDEILTHGWKAPKPKDMHHSTPWGPFSYFTMCNEDYRSPNPCSVKFKFPNKYDLMPGLCGGIEFQVNNYMSVNPRCQYIHNHSGIRDPYQWVDPENKNLIYPMDLGVYHMLNTVLVEEVITGTPIEVLHVDAKIDMGSWLWSFSVTVASKCFLDIIKPQGGVLGNIKINMNGWIFYCTVEGWSENRTFGSDAWTISGRSPSLLFGAPVCEPKSNIITTGKQGQTIFEDYMIGRTYAPGWPFTSWEVDFADYYATLENPTPTATGFQPSSDWYLPEDTVSYSDKTDIDFLKELAESIGAYIQTDPSTSTGLSSGISKLKIKPRFAHQPWSWFVNDTPNANINWKTINEAQCVEIGRSNDVRTEYQAVNVLGESLRSNEFNSGAESTSVYVNVVRNGWDSGGNEGSSGKYAPMVTNPYITGSKSGLEHGRMILGGSGEWVKHSLRIGILCQSNGLYNVGDMVSVLERGQAWYGQVTGVSVAAVSAGTGFAVEQQIEVEEYRGE